MDNDIKNIGTKCYKSVSCIISILLILFIFGAVVYDIGWEKPALRNNITEINSELNDINRHINKIDSQQSISTHRFYETILKNKSKND